jgi:2-isopropylmalate synthase
MHRNADSYQHLDPEIVGNKFRTIVSELSGKGNLVSKAKEFDIAIEDKDELKDILSKIKRMEARGFSFESAEASVALMFHRLQDGYTPPFELIDFSATVEHRQGRGVFAEAMVKIRVNGEIIHTISEGNGPVNALDAALRKGLVPIYPRLAEFQLADYKVRIIDGNNGTAATTRVLIDTQNGYNRWSTVGASANIIEASWQALADSVEYGLMLK